MHIWGWHMIKMSVCKSSANRLQNVGLIVGTVFAASSVQAGAWDLLETQCVVPMENAQLIETAGLVELPDIAAEPGTEIVGQDLPTGRYFVMVAQEGSKTIGCGFSAIPSATEAFEYAWLEWRKQALLSGRYVAGEATGFFKLPFIESTFRDTHCLLYTSPSPRDRG